MKHISLVFALVILGSTSWADNIHYLNSGPSVTVGPISNSQLSTASRFNPAASSVNTERTRIALLDFTANLQLKGLGEFNTVFEDMSDQIDSISKTFDSFSDGDAGVGDVLGEVNSLESAFDRNIELLADSFYAKPGAIVSLPLTPVGVNLNQYGTLSLGLSSLTQARASILHGPITFDIDAQTIIDSSDAGEDLDPIDYLRTTSSLYLKQAQVFNLDVAWSKDIPSINFLDQYGIEAVGGVRATLIGYNLQKHLYPIKDVARQATNEDDTSTSLTEDITDDIMAGFSDYSYTIALDAGITLKRDNTLVGLTIYNINSPSLEYNQLGGDCSSIEDAYDQSECFHAEYFTSVGDMALKESHALSPRVTLDATHGFLDNNIAIAGVVDLLPKNDLFGDQSQNINFGVLLQPTQWYWPRFRLGFGKDLQDLDPTQLGLGLSLFNFLQIDSQMTAVLADLSSDDLTKQGNALRSASVSASINLAF